jgi:hypothetical protein
MFYRVCRDKRDAAGRLRQSLQALCVEECSPQGIRESILDQVLADMEELAASLRAWMVLEPLMDDEQTEPVTAALTEPE